jgi:hypothetical protein
MSNAAIRVSTASLRVEAENMTRNVHQVLRQKEIEMARVRHEIEVLVEAASLLREPGEENPIPVSRKEIKSLP